MEEESLNRCLGRLRDTPLPPCPADLEQKVFNSLQQEEISRAENPWNSLFEHFFQRGLAGATIAVILIASFLLTYVSSSIYAAEMDKRMEARRVLDFEFVKATEWISYHE